MLEDEETIPTVGQVAEASGMTSRTFQRRLKEEDRTFKALLDDVRQERALHLVTDGEEPIGHVASLLGYSRPTSLNRAMMRWTGMNPTAFRNTGS